MSAQRRYAVEVSPKADREFTALGREVQERLTPRIDSLAEQPRPPGVQKLAGDEDLYRIRVGPYRVIYEIDDARRRVVIASVGDRKEVYLRRR